MTSIWFSEVIENAASLPWRLPAVRDGEGCKLAGASRANAGLTGGATCTFDARH